MRPSLRPPGTPFAASAALTLMVVLLLWTVPMPLAHAQTFTTLYNFTGSPDGASPRASLIRDAAGNLYGTTEGGGVGGYGAVFKLDTRGQETVLYSFTGSPDGAYPLAGLIRDAAGNLYGTTSSGGAHVTSGTVFELKRKAGGVWTEKVLHSFTNRRTDGNMPVAGVIFDGQGNLYGTTYQGGSLGSGTVFKLSPTSGGHWKETILHSFGRGTDGTNPSASLILDHAGHLYGTTTFGGGVSGCLSGPPGCGTVFKMARAKSGSWNEKTLHAFTGYPDRGNPYSGLVRDAGTLYGTTASGGYKLYGTVFSVTNTGTYSSLVSFMGYPWAGSPLGGVVFDALGNSYGSAGQGEAGEGTVFEFDTAGQLIILHSFAGTDGANPVAGLVRDKAGNLYGTTKDGGRFSQGTVFELTPAPPIY
jgi:uncharacterized repeat protein (TIGR03803 family)